MALLDAYEKDGAFLDQPAPAAALHGASDPAPGLRREPAPGDPLGQRYCDEHRLSLRDRRELFLSVCGALQHAHQKGVGNSRETVTTSSPEAKRSTTKDSIIAREPQRQGAVPPGHEPRRGAAHQELPKAHRWLP
jgi:hypothetical protein